MYVKPPKQPKRIAGFHRTEWEEFKSLPPVFQAIKDALALRERIS